MACKLHQRISVILNKTYVFVKRKTGDGLACSLFTKFNNYKTRAYLQLNVQKHFKEEKN